MVVTEAMVAEKSLQSGFAGAIMISNKAMTQSQHQQKMNQVIKKYIDKKYEEEYESYIDARGLLVYGMIHCQGAQHEKQSALIKVYEKIRAWSGDKE